MTPSTSSTPDSNPELGGATCGGVLSRGQIGSRIGAGFPTKDVFLALAPDAGTGILDGLDCQYAVAASGQWTVQVQLIRYSGADRAALAIQEELGRRAPLGGISSTTTIGDRPANVMISDGGFLVMQLDSSTLSVEIPDGVLDGPRSKVAVTAFAEFCLTNIPDLGESFAPTQ